MSSAGKFALGYICFHFRYSWVLNYRHGASYLTSSMLSFFIFGIWAMCSLLKQEYMCRVRTRPEPLQVVATIAMTTFVNNSLGLVLAFPGQREHRGGGAEGREAASVAKTQQSRQVGAKGGTRER